MRYLAIAAAAGLLLAGCEGTPGMPTIFTGGGGGGVAAAQSDSPRQAEFVALVEAQGCRIDPQDHAFVHEAGFSDLEIGEFGKTLSGEGRAEVTADGGLVLMTERCI
jgi:hypothetical protein